MITHLVFIFVLTLATNVNGYCWQAGHNPGWSGPPKVSQRAMDLVRVSWKDMVTQRECADNFVVKYWPKSAPANYRVTDLVAKSANFVDIKVTPKIDYNFQAVAREDKGLIGGVDWNKSPTVQFKTSSTFVPPKTQPSVANNNNINTG